MNTSLGRFRVVGQNQLSMPGKCAVCGTTSGDFLDFGFDQEFYGTIYFCFDNCFREAANAFEYMSPAQHNIALDQIEFLRGENNQLKDQLGEMKRVFGSLVNNISSPSDFGSGLVVVDEKSKLTYKEPESNNTGSQDSKPELNEQINESGYSILQRDASIDDIIRESEIDI